MSEGGDRSAPPRGLRSKSAADAAPLEAAFRQFAARLTAPEFVESLAKKTEIDAEDLSKMLVSSVAESVHTVRLIEHEDLAGKRTLEIGAGLGITSCFLAERGLDHVSLEPGAVGFESYRELARSMRDLLCVSHEHLSMPAEDLDPEVHGRFDLIFSNNVMEHVPRVDVCLEKLHKMLAAGGRMLHNCPNYLVPYEPHFGVPLVPLFPTKTSRLLPRSITDEGLWKSLNFVTLPQVARIAKKLGARVEFQPGVMHGALMRLGDEPEFRSRHRMLSRLYPLIRATGVLAFSRLIPARFCTPMVFAWADGARLDTETGGA